MKTEKVVAKKADTIREANQALVKDNENQLPSEKMIDEDVTEKVAGGHRTIDGRNPSA